MEGIRFMNNLIENSNINVAKVCRIESYDTNTMMATVTPLVEEHNDLPLLIQVPVLHFNMGGFTIASEYKQGDIVVVLFLDTDTDNVLISGDKSTPNSDRKHSLDDAIVLGSISTLKHNNPKIDNSLIIKGENNEICLHKNGDIDIKGKNINFKGNVTGIRSEY